MTAPQKAHVLLTETVKKGGCAAKLPAGDLSAALKSLRFRPLPELAVGADTMDDAALWDLGDDRYLIQTLDFFTPMIDDPHEFGAVAAANALSDVYAMGGQPKTALTILAFPSQVLSLDLLLPLMRGAVEKIEEAGACLAGGHSIDDDTLKLGFSVAGFVKKGEAWKNSGAKPGDTLILTKALGTGTISSALKNKQADPDWIRAAIASMTQLNRAPELLRGLTVNAATDITGFGLASHALHISRASQVNMEVMASRLPILPGAVDCLERKVLNRAHRTNADYVKEEVAYESGISEAMRWLTVDPQTSGGLLLSVPSEQTDLVLERLRARFPLAAAIGTVKTFSASYPSVRFTN